MAQIRILPDNVSNQIAAGEVVERPMSVIKELLENAIDAGATRISIEFRNGGKSFMSIEDNGDGMPPDQALLALERHATSKIQETADLDTIHSFGFRGEALPSIASISNFVLRTRTEEAESGAEILIEGGKYRHCREFGMPKGTRIEISRLFFNVPARLKFLKTENTEAAHITRCVRLYAVAHPEIAFTLWENGREIFRSPAGVDLRSRVGAIWGRQLADDLIPLQENKNAEMKVFGLIGKPGVSRTSRTEMVTIVNGRPVDNRTMAYSLVESYHTLIPRGRYPLAFLFLEIDPHMVDVNVHPAKREVRFRNESSVRNFIISTVLRTLGQADEETQHSHPVPINDFVSTVEKTKKLDIPVEIKRPELSVSTTPRQTQDESQKTTGCLIEKPTPSLAKAIKPFPEKPREKEHDETNIRKKSEFQTTSLWTSWRSLGRLGFDGLILFHVEKSLLIFNPRLALERIWYERTLERFKKSERLSQSLLIPEPIEFEPVLANILLQNKAILNAAGFEIEEFGRNFFRVTEVPDWLSITADIKMFVRDLVDRIARHSVEFSRKNIAHEMLARIAATEAIRTRNSLPENENLPEILRALFLTSQPNVSPNGQKIYVEITHAEIARRFL